jgi:hypothetical protein
MFGLAWNHCEVVGRQTTRNWRSNEKRQRKSTKPLICSHVFCQKFNIVFNLRHAIGCLSPVLRSLLEQSAQTFRHYIEGQIPFLRRGIQ